MRTAFTSFPGQRACPRLHRFWVIPRCRHHAGRLLAVRRPRTPDLAAFTAKLRHTVRFLLGAVGRTPWRIDSAAGYCGASRTSACCWRATPLMVSPLTAGGIHPPWRSAARPESPSAITCWKTPSTCYARYDKSRRRPLARCSRRRLAPCRPRPSPSFTGNRFSSGAGHEHRAPSPPATASKAINLGEPVQGPPSTC